MNEDRRGGCPVCRSTRRPLLCPNCVNRGHLNDLALRTARQHKQKLLERVNRALEVQVCTKSLRLTSRFTQPRESRRGRCTQSEARRASGSWNCRSFSCLESSDDSQRTTSQIERGAAACMLSETTACHEESCCWPAEEEGGAGITAAATCRAPGLHQDGLSTRSRGRGAAAEEYAHLSACHAYLLQS